MIDADLQDPPELIPELVEWWRKGSDVVVAAREAREGETRFKLMTASWFYRLLGRVAQIEVEQNAGDFRLLSRRALDALLAMPERNRYIRGMTAWVGFTHTSVPYSRAARHAGETKFSLFKMLRFSFDAIASFSYVPLADRDAARVLLRGDRVPRHPGRDRIPDRGRVRPRRHHHRDRGAAARRHPADGDRDHRRVPRARVRRGQAAAAVPRAVEGRTSTAATAREGRGDRGRRRRPRRRAPAGRSRARRATCTSAGPGSAARPRRSPVGQGHLLERYYHHLFTSDRHIAELYDELGMPDELEWRPSSVAFFAEGRSWPFNGPLDLLRFRPLSLARAPAHGRRRPAAPAAPPRRARVRERDGARVGAARDGPPGVGEDLGPAAARQVRRPRDRHLDVVAVEQAHRPPPDQGRRGAPGAARLPARELGDAVRAAPAVDRSRAGAA